MSLEVETKLSDISKYIDSYFTIEKHENNYIVFTEVTQHFTVEKITDLTPKLFEEMIEKHKKRIEQENYYFNNLHNI
jgi:hypothetical protein